MDEEAEDAYLYECMTHRIYSSKHKRAPTDSIQCDSQTVRPQSRPFGELVSSQASRKGSGMQICVGARHQSRDFAPSHGWIRFLQLNSGRA